MTDICQYCGSELQTNGCINPACPGRLRREAMSELKPCPFCGAKGRTLKHVSPGQLGRFDDDTGQTAIVCDCNDYGCGAMGGFRNSSQEAEESWNTRTPATAEVEDLLDHIISAANSVSIPSESNYLNELKSRLLATLTNATPYLSQDVKGVYKYEIDSPDELDAGLHGFGDEVTVIVDSGEPGGDPTGEDSFEEYMRQALIEWFDGAKVVFKKAGE